MSDKIKVSDLYEALVKDGADVGTEKEFTDWFFKPGGEGYRNRKAIFDAFHDDGDDVGDSYEDFSNRLGLISKSELDQQKSQPAPQSAPQPQAATQHAFQAAPQPAQMQPVQAAPQEAPTASGRQEVSTYQAQSAPKAPELASVVQGADKDASTATSAAPAPKKEDISKWSNEAIKSDIEAIGNRVAMNQAKAWEKGYGEAQWVTLKDGTKMPVAEYDKALDAGEVKAEDLDYDPRVAEKGALQQTADEVNAVRAKGATRTPDAEKPDGGIAYYNIGETDADGKPVRYIRHSDKDSTYVLNDPEEAHRAIGKVALGGTTMRPFNLDEAVVTEYTAANAEETLRRELEQAEMELGALMRRRSKKTMTHMAVTTC